MATPRKMLDVDEESVYEPLCVKAAAILIAYWRLYPDRFAAFCEAEHPDYTLAPIQCMMMRAEVRNEEVFITGGRGLTKSYTGLLCKMQQGVLYPGIQMQYFGPTLKQTTQIISDAFQRISKNYPLLASMWEVKANTIDHFRIETRYGSSIDVAVVRGTNASSAFFEEVAQQEKGEAFDHEKLRQVVIPAVRIHRLVDGQIDPMLPDCQKTYVTSAGRQQNEAFGYRSAILKKMVEGYSGFAMDIPASVAVLNGIRNLSWYNDLKSKETPEEFLRELGSIWTGTCENPVIRDSTLTESKTVTVMENRHCGDPNVIYIVSYDVSYADGSKNAKCATSVLKCERQWEEHKKDRFLKSVVYVMDEDPKDSMIQARKLKERWFRFCLDGGQATYIAIDARSYGRAVLEDLHKDLGDGLPPLCCVEHDLPELELDGALPVIYQINATGGYSIGYRDDHDNENDMLRYAEVEWEQRNVRILTSNINEGVLAYKRVHRIKDDVSDPTIARPYLKCREMAGQISNLKKRQAGAGFREERISRSINRDMWSATKYALRIAQRLERKNLLDSIHRESEWQKAFEGGMDAFTGAENGERRALRNKLAPRVLARTGGNMRR